MAAFEGLLFSTFEITKITNLFFQTLHALLPEMNCCRFNQLDGHPAISLTKRTILLRDRIDGRKELIDYEDTSSTEMEREPWYNQ